MLDRLIGQQLSFAIADYCVYVHRNPSRFIGLESNRRDYRIEHFPLPCPVIAYRFATV